MPDIGDFDQVAVIEVFVKPGDSVKVEQSLITVESDKASMEIPSSHAGVVEKVLVAIGDKVAKGSPVVLLKGAAGPLQRPLRRLPQRRRQRRQPQPPRRSRRRVWQRWPCRLTIPPPLKASCRTRHPRSAARRANSACR